MTDIRGIKTKRPRDSRSMCYELAKSGIALPLLFTPQCIHCDDNFKSILNAKSDIRPAKDDPRFQDAIWHQNAIYRASMQTYLSWCDSLRTQVDSSDLNQHDKMMLRQAVEQLASKLAPTTRPGNSPVQHAYESRGASLVHDLHRMTDDLLQYATPDQPAQKNKLLVGKHIAATAGTVIHRTEMLEIIQYTPVSDQVQSIPLLIIPSPISRFYLCDLQKGSSLVHYLLRQGFQVYSLSWRNPENNHGHWNLEDYTAASIAAIDKVANLTSDGKVNVFGFAAGGMLSALACCISSQRPQGCPVNSLTLAITSLITQSSSQVGTKLNDEMIAAAKTLAQSHEISDARELARNFAWLCPNNLLWNPLVCNYFGGEFSPEADIFQWNNDTLRTTAGLHCDFLAMSQHNPLLEDGQLSLCGHPVNLSNINCDSYTLAGSCDHIAPWEACYKTHLALGGKSEFVLVNRGHARTLVCPVDGPEAFFYTASETTPNTDDWLCDATQHRGSWWPHWKDWLANRSGPVRNFERQPGDAEHPKQDSAPGRYVFK